MSTIEPRSLEERASAEGRESAFARTATVFPNGNWDFGTAGLSKREFIAAMAMQAIATSTSNGWARRTDASHIAETAVAIADALLAELVK